LEEVEIHLSFKRRITPRFHKNYHSDPERRKNMIARVVSDIYIKGQVSQEQKALLLDELEHCPLHNTLMRPPELVENIHIVTPEQEIPEPG
jgi:uncharacterized OsmC-like protein